MGFVRDIAGDTGKNPKGQRLFKIKDNKVYISSAYELSAADEDTGVRIVPDKPQGLMIKKDAQGNVTYFYQDGGEKDLNSPAWKNITPAASPAGNLTGFDIDLGHIGVNSLREDETAQVTLTLRGNTIVDITNNILGYPIEKHRKFRDDAVRLKKVRYFVTEERFLWW